MKVFHVVVTLGIILLVQLLVVSCDKGDDDLRRKDSSSKVSDKKLSSQPSKPPANSQNTVEETRSNPRKSVATKPAKPQVKTKIDRLVEKRYPMPQFTPLSQITNNWTRIPDRSLPEAIQVTSPIQCTLYQNGQATRSTTIKVGSKLKPLKVLGSQLTVASFKDASIQARVPISQTNLKQAIQNRYDGLVDDYKKNIYAQRASAKKALLKRPERVESFTKPRVAATGDVPPQILSSVKNSIKRGEAGPGKLSEANSFSWNGTENLGGTFSGNYETVTVFFETVTIFGAFPNEFKCVLSEGRVKGWIDPISEERVDR